MMTFKRIKYAVKSALLRLYSRHICPPPTDAKKIPVIINNFNRLTTLKRLIASLTSRGIDNIIILDNASTYPPLLDWYKECGHTVIHLEGNLGFKALWKSRLTKNLYRKGWYIYTDSDVELAKDCPDDIIERMLHVMTVERPSALKTGPSLLINDLPDCFANKTDVIAHEQKFWEHREGDLFRAPIDTTFALYRPMSSVFFTATRAVFFSLSLQYNVNYPVTIPDADAASALYTRGTPDHLSLFFIMSETS